MRGKDAIPKVPANRAAQLADQVRTFAQDRAITIIEAVVEKLVRSKDSRRRRRSGRRGDGGREVEALR